MKRPSFGALKDTQEKMSRQISTDDALQIDDIRYIAGFDISYAQDKCVCAAVVLDFKTMEVVERKYVVAKPPMNYVPGFVAFREGPLMVQAYYDLEYEPDVLMVEGHGIAHPLKAGVASFVGTELVKPTIGASKSAFDGDVQDGKLIVDGEIRGEEVVTKEYARPVYVSVGHMLSLPTAVEIVKKCIIPPHKLPEPVHKAHRHADKILKEEKQKKEKVIEG